MFPAGLMKALTEIPQVMFWKNKLFRKLYVFSLLLFFSFYCFFCFLSKPCGWTLCPSFHRDTHINYRPSGLFRQLDNRMVVFQLPCSKAHQLHFWRHKPKPGIQTENILIWIELFAWSTVIPRWRTATLMLLWMPFVVYLCRSRLKWWEGSSALCVYIRPFLASPSGCSATP